MFNLPMALVLNFRVMRLPLFAFSSILFFAFGGLAQPSDSLLKRIASEPGNSRENADRYLRLSGIELHNHPVMAFDYAQKGLQAASAGKGNPLMQSHAYHMLAMAAEAMGTIHRGVGMADSALYFARLQPDSQLVWNAYSTKAKLLRRQAKNAEALLLYQEAERVARFMKSDLLQAKSLANLGVMYLTMGDIERSEQFHLQSLAIREKMGYKNEISNSYNNLGIVNREKKDYAKALDYYFKALRIYEQLSDSSDISFAYNDIGAAFSFSGNLKAAEDYLQRSIALRLRMQEYNELAYTYNYLGENYERKNDLVNAERYIKLALQTAIDIGNNKQRYEALESLSDFYKRHQRYDSAYTYLSQYRQLRDSLNQANRMELISELTTRYETAEKERTIQAQRFAISRRNYLLGASALVLVLGAGLGVGRYRRLKLEKDKQIQQEIMRQQELSTKAVMEAEESERRRIAAELHDGVGQMMSAARMNLSSLESDWKDLTVERRLQLERVSSLVDESCREVRSVSHNMMPNALLKRGLAAAIRDFLDKIDHRVLKVNLHTEGLDKRLDQTAETMIYRIIQEAVNNVIKHSGANQLDIALMAEDDHLSVSIEDNGHGFDTSALSAVEGIGMKNMLSRVQFLKGSLDLNSQPGRGTLVAIHVPLNTNNA
jgi:signal transduction histidine kinase